MRKITVKIGKPKPINANIEEPKDVEAVLRDVTLRRTSGTTNHDELTGRDLPNQHPMSSIEGLELALDKKQPVGNYALKKEIPSKTSELENDNEFITKTVSDLVNYYAKQETYSREEIDNKISSIPKFSIEVVSSLPTTNISTTTVYLIASGDEQDNLYTEYIYVNGVWEYLGKQTVDLTGYVKRTELSSYYTKTDIDALIETIRSSIPTKLSQLTEDASHRLVSDSEKQSWNNKQPAGDYVTNTELNAKGYAKQTDVNNLQEEIDDQDTRIQALENNPSGATEEQIAQIETNKNDIADIKEDLIELSQIEAPKIVSSVDEMTDTTKHYVLDGYIYQNEEVVIEGETVITYPNQFVASAATLNSRLSGSGGGVSSRTGYFVTDFIEVPNFAGTTPYNARLNWEMPYGSSYDSKVLYFGSSKNLLGYGFLDADNVSTANGETVINIKAGYSTAPSEASVVYVRFQLHLNSSLASVTSDAIDNCKITFDTVYEETTTEPTVKSDWVNTGITYAPTFKTDLVGVLGENNVIYLSDNLPSGTYTLKYPDNNYATIGTISK